MESHRLRPSEALGGGGGGECFLFVDISRTIVRYRSEGRDVEREVRVSSGEPNHLVLHG